MKSKQLLFLLLLLFCCLMVSISSAFASTLDSDLSDGEIDYKLTAYQEILDIYCLNKESDIDSDIDSDKNIVCDYYGLENQSLNLDNSSDNIRVSILGDSISSFYGYNDYSFIGNYYLTEDDYKNVETFLINKKEELALTLEELEKQAVSNPSKELDDKIAKQKELIETYDNILKCFYEKCKMKVENTWWMNFILSEGFSLGYNDSLGGSCVAWDGKSDINLTISSDTRINKLGTNGTPDIIFVFGGINDVLSQCIEIGQYDGNASNHTVNTFVGAYDIMLDKIQAKYPNAKVVCIIPYDTVYSIIGSEASMISSNAKLLHDNIVNICKSKNITYVDLTGPGILDFNSDFTSDYIHLNENGMQKVTLHIKEALKNDGEFNKPKKAYAKVNNVYRSGIDASLHLDVINKKNIEYKWYAVDKNNNRININDWSKDNYNICWTPDTNGDYKLCGMARVSGDDSTIVESSCTASYNACIKGICQIPYQGPGGGYLIGLETYDNPNQSYKYEMQILDCTLLAEGKDAWIYTTDRCHVSKGNALWTIWQPQYGYYWTLFRVYDKNNKLIDQECYGFANAY